MQEQEEHVVSLEQDCERALQVSLKQLVHEALSYKRKP